MLQITIECELGNKSGKCLIAFSVVRSVIVSSMCIMLSQWMNTLFLYFDLLGFCSQYKVSTNRWKFDLFILTSHTILGLLTTLIIIISYLMRPVDVLNDLLKFSVLFFVHWLSIIELYSKQKTQRKC